MDSISRLARKSIALTALANALRDYMAMDLEGLCDAAFSGDADPIKLANEADAAAALLDAEIERLCAERDAMAHERKIDAIRDAMREAA